jgi:hypothetical protein
MSSELNDIPSRNFSYTGHAEKIGRPQRIILGGKFISVCSEDAFNKLIYPKLYLLLLQFVYEKYEYLATLNEEAVAFK